MNYFHIVSDNIKKLTLIINLEKEYSLFLFKYNLLPCINPELPKMNELKL